VEKDGCIPALASRRTTLPLWQSAARTKSVFICLLEEHEILCMKNGDDDLRIRFRTIVRSGRGYALDEPFSSFLVCWSARALSAKSLGIS